MRIILIFVIYLYWVVNDGFILLSIYLFIILYLMFKSIYFSCSLYKSCIFIFLRYNVLISRVVRYLSVAGNDGAGNSKQGVKVNFHL